VSDESAVQVEQRHDARFYARPPDVASLRSSGTVRARRPPVRRERRRGYDPQPPFDSGSVAKASRAAKDYLAAR
jgi:hypothetical protein